MSSSTMCGAPPGPGCLGCHANPQCGVNDEDADVDPRDMPGMEE